MGKFISYFLGKPFHTPYRDPVSPPSIPFRSSALTQFLVLSLLKKNEKKTHLYLHINSTETETKLYKQNTDKIKTMPKTNLKKKEKEKKCLQRQL